MTRILVTGADGFIGRALSGLLIRQGHDLVRVVRSPGDAAAVAVGDIADQPDWTQILAGVTVVVHLAARAHITAETSKDPLNEFRRVNVAATVGLARAAASAAVRRFVFLSSIGVNGNDSQDRAFCEADLPNPSEPYAISKWEAEQALQEIGGTTGMQITRVRPPLIVGPGAKGNLRRLMRLVDSGLPLPLGAIRNSRSFVALEDLCELISSCVSHDRAADDLFLASGAEEVSTPELLRAIGAGLGRAVHLVPVPLAALRLAARSCGLQSQLDRIASSLRVNACKARTVLGWQPRSGLHTAIESMTAAYLHETSR